MVKNSDDETVYQEDNYTNTSVIIANQTACSIYTLSLTATNNEGFSSQDTHEWTIVLKSELIAIAGFREL